ncbi:YdeI/OmpD-associated family protein [Cohnella candidum]|uniref:DUF1905 domain-containing protein n=1 Tax=Cohnella candidum TaxID=2674991 RepID=A0A3G3K0G6_9BACL|nr:YdeI/OmpD-associated family protein [Cohnella candidum]AYQ73913.1 DUF1905 domain-containing protein [Cohnella candidum]
MSGDSRVYEFDAVIRREDDIDAAFVEFPYDVEKEFGTKGQVKVSVRFDSAVYRGSLAQMGMPKHCIGLTKAIRTAIGKQPGDTVHVVLKRDEEPRVVEVPEELSRLLERHPEAKRAFAELSYTNRKEYAVWIRGAKKKETREARLGKTIDMLLNGVKHP